MGPLVPLPLDSILKANGANPNISITAKSDEHDEHDEHVRPNLATTTATTSTTTSTATSTTTTDRFELGKRLQAAYGAWHNGGVDVDAPSERHQDKDAPPMTGPHSSIVSGGTAPVPVEGTMAEAVRWAAHMSPRTIKSIQAEIGQLQEEILATAEPGNWRFHW